MGGKIRSAISNGQLGRSISGTLAALVGFGSARDDADQAIGIRCEIRGRSSTPGRPGAGLRARCGGRSGSWLRRAFDDPPAFKPAR
jgi:hypothetical protein